MLRDERVGTDGPWGKKVGSPQGSGIDSKTKTNWELPPFFQKLLDLGPQQQIRMHFYVSGFEPLGTSERKVEISVRNLSRGTIFPKSVEPRSAYDIPTSIG